MLSHDEALELLKSKGLTGRVLRHSMASNKVSNYLAGELSKKGVEIDLELVDVGSLLHDIGRSVSQRWHTPEGAKVMNELGEPEIAKIVGSHDLLPFPKLTKIETKIVNYGDKRIKEGSIVSLKDRFDDLIVRYPGIDKVLEKVTPDYKKFEDEIFGIIGEEKRDLEMLKE